MQKPYKRIDALNLIEQLQAIEAGVKYSPQIITDILNALNNQEFTHLIISNSTATGKAILNYLQSSDFNSYRAMMRAVLRTDNPGPYFNTEGGLVF